MFKKVFSFMLAADFAIGALTCGVKKAEQRTVEKMQAIEECIEHNDSTYAAVKTRQERYINDSLGVFSLTFYVPDKKWGYQTATGVRSQHLATCAVDPNVIPLGSVIQITGDNGQVLKLKCVDKGNLVIGNKIDIFYDSNNYGGVQAGYDWIARFGTVHTVYLLEE